MKNGLENVYVFDSLPLKIPGEIYKYVLKDHTDYERVGWGEIPSYKMDALFRFKYLFLLILKSYLCFYDAENLWKTQLS